MRNFSTHLVFSGHLLWILSSRHSLPPSVAESRNTIDGVAQRYGVNANLVHKLRQQFPQQPASGLSG